jgi:hypothetical protein
MVLIGTLLAVLIGVLLVCPAETLWIHRLPSVWFLPDVASSLETARCLLGLRADPARYRRKVVLRLLGPLVVPAHWPQ